MVSLGGQAIKASTFSSFITDLKSLNNLTSSINKLYRDGIVDGVELDWEWPFSNGKKDRIKLIRYARVSLFILLLSMVHTTTNFKKLGVTFMNVPKSFNRAIPSQGNVPLRHHLGNEKTTFHVFCHQIR